MQLLQNQLHILWKSKLSQLNDHNRSHPKSSKNWKQHSKPFRNRNEQKRIVRQTCKEGATKGRKPEKQQKEKDLNSLTHTSFLRPFLQTTQFMAIFPHFQTICWVSADSNQKRILCVRFRICLVNFRIELFPGSVRRCRGSIFSV